jgi:hypothetical protein
MKSFSRESQRLVFDDMAEKSPDTIAFLQAECGL